MINNLLRGDLLILKILMATVVLILFSVFLSDARSVRVKSTLTKTGTYIYLSKNIAIICDPNE